jgi:hypothetical protein
VRVSIIELVFTLRGINALAGRLIKKILKKDRMTYGTDNYTIRDEAPSDIQTEIDQLIEARNDGAQDGDDEPLDDEEGEDEHEGEGGISRNSQAGNGTQQPEEQS